MATVEIIPKGYFSGLVPGLACSTDAVEACDTLRCESQEKSNPLIYGFLYGLLGFLAGFRGFL